MRSAYEESDNVWPHDMEIRLQTVEPHILELLFVRHVWALPNEPALPPLDPAPVFNAEWVPVQSKQEMSDRWGRAWRDGWEWSRLARQAVGSTAEDIQFSLGLPSRWPETEGWSQADRNGCEEWIAGLDLIQPGRETEENAVLSSLISAWRRRLLFIVVMPYQGAYASKLDDRTLAVSRHTHSDAHLYSEALEGFV